MTIPQWRGRGVAKARAILADRTTWPASCARCGKKLHRADEKSWRCGHIKDRWEYPELTWDPANWQVECAKCSDSSGQAAVISKAKKSANSESEKQSATPPIFPAQSTPAQSPPLPLHTHESQAQPVVVRPGLSWSDLCQDAPDWLLPYLEIPEDAAPPLWVSGVHKEAVGSYGAEAIAWMEEHLKERGKPLVLRWWQRLAVVLQLQHREDGSLCKRVIIESGPRRIGKSVRLRSMAIWRLAHGPDLFEDEQLILHTGKDLAIVREVLRKAWPWADSTEGWASKRGMTEPEISYLSVNRWVARSKDATNGYDCCLGLVDESWDVKPEAIDDDMEPTMLERESPQLLLTSTAHRRATSLMRGRILTALTTDEPEVMLLVWGAPPGSDPGNPEVWRSASPHWSDDRAQMIAAKYAKALAGEQDPEFDDHDPMEGFKAQYLNAWRLRDIRTDVGNQVITEEAWVELAVPQPAPAPDAVAVESWYDQGVCVAEAWRGADGAVTVRVTDHPTLDLAAAHVASLGLRKPAIVGTSLAEHPAWKTNRVRVTSASAATRTQVGELMRTLRDGTLRHTSASALTDQVLALRTTPGTDGPRVRNTDRQDGIKAAMWAASAAASSTRRRAAIPTRYKAHLESQVVS